MNNFMVVVAAALTLQNPGLPKKEFFDAVQALHAELKDFEFIFEGRRFVTDAAGATEKRRASIDDSFQGQYVYRSDGATYLELFRRNAENTPIGYFVTSAIDGEVQESRMPLTKADAPAIIKRRGTAELWAISHNPADFIYLHYFRRLREDLDSVDYAFEGWENVDGHPTARVRIARGNVGGRASSTSRRLWIDLKRGGHVLRCESLHGDRLTKRVHEIQLQRFSGKSGDAWLPVSAAIDQFTWDAQWYEQPTFVERIYCVSASIVVNSAIPDARFDLKRRLKHPEGERLRGLRKEFVERSDHEPLATDGKSIKERLDRQIKEAQEQGAVLDASATAQIEDSSRTNRLYLVASGVALLGLAFLYFVRRRGQA